MRGLRFFFFIAVMFFNVIFGARQSEAQSRPGFTFFLEGAYGFSAGYLYKEVREMGPVWNVGAGFKYDSFMLSLAMGKYVFAKTEVTGSTGKLSHQNSISLTEVVGRYEVFDSLGISFGYAKMNHLENSFLYEEIVPGQESAVAQAGSLTTSEGAILAGVFSTFSFTNFDVFLEGRYYQTQTNKIHLGQVDLGLRYYF